MTFTIVGRCGRTGQLGVGIATYSLGVGGKAPAVASRLGAIATQAFVNPTFKGLGLRLLALGHPAAQVLDLLKAGDPQIAYRQVAIVDRWGGAACHTGLSARDRKGHVADRNVVACGNVLAGEGVCTAMAEAFAASEPEPLHERLLRAIEAGRDAGGQVGGSGHLPERSASLLVHGDDEHPLLDLRVDSHPEAVAEMRRLHDEFVPYLDFYRSRWIDPANAIPQEQFVASLNRREAAG